MIKRNDLKNKVYLHIGLGRSGSDFLQKKIFPKISNIKYVDRYISQKFNNFRINLFYNPFFNIKRDCKFSIKGRTLISSENFFNPDYSLNQLKEKINNFSKSPHIILVLREPFSHLVSTYKYSVTHGNLWQTIDDIFDFQNTRRARNMSNNIVFYKNFYDYKILINFLKNQYKFVEIFKFEEIFYSYQSMNNFLNILKNRLNFDLKITFNKKNFLKLNSSLDDKEVEKKRIKNFKKTNNFILNSNLKNTYFEAYYTKNFKKKFLDSLNFNYAKLF